VIPASCNYERPATIGDAFAALADPDAKVLAGGQSLVPMMKLRLARPSTLVDVCGIVGAHVEQIGGALHVGAGVTYDELLRSGAVVPTALAEAARSVGDLQIRNAGTIGGALAHADPACDIAAPMLSLDATLRLQSPSGERLVAIDEFFTGPYTTVLDAQELVMEAILPAPGDHAAGSAYVSFEDLASGYPIVGVAVCVEAQDGRVARCGAAVTGVGPSPTRVPALEAALLGQRDAELPAAIDGVELLAGEHADYHRHLLRVAANRAFACAADRAQGRAT
jgi:carbon-monoxide dehydrogenase medium subunit